ncbi:MAG TPA: hypothetical protein VMG82_09970 [Candidatus Sulfotelmatobacter sp.]|nr:hypothetical protein [Candidatus Sulfotelmatobacter sp.]
MKFSEKYELLETLTTGAVETFVANDKVRGERVLVHIVECAPQKPDQTTAEWVLDSFRKEAPEPPGPVLETGKYSSPKYGYVVVKPAGENAVKAWVRRYELQAEETKETTVHGPKTEVKVAAGAPIASPVVSTQPLQASGSMTQLLREFDSLDKSKRSEAARSMDLPATKSAPSTNLPGETGPHTANLWDAAGAKSGGLSSEPPFTPPPVPRKPVSIESPPSVGRETSKPGEFTSFFQGPFQGDRSADMPSFSSQPIEPPRKTVGEFTAVFGQSSSPAPESAVPATTSEPSFTSIFQDMGTPQSTFKTPARVPGEVIPAAPQPLPAAPPVDATPLSDPVFVAPTPTPVVTPVPTPTPSPSLTVERSAPPGSAPRHGDGATGAFMRVPAKPAVPVEPQSGPSPYTQIISRPQHVETEEVPTGQSPAAGASPFAAPPLPRIPAAAPPPIPKMPPPPRIAPPPVPKMKAPAVPKLPRVDAPAPPPVSIWPLIITLTVLFFLAVILVLFFVLRH